MTTAAPELMPPSVGIVVERPDRRLRRRRARGTSPAVIWRALLGSRLLASQVFRLAWPAITHMLLVTLVFLVDRAMIGRYSSSALASMQISGTLMWTVYSVFTAFSAGTLAVVARNVGKGDREAAAAACRASLELAFALGVAVTVVFLLATAPLLSAVFPTADPEVLLQAKQYLAIVVPVLPLAFVEAIAAASLQAAGDTRAPLFVAAAGNVVKVLVSSVLIFGALGFPRLGVRGAAIGTAIAMGTEGLLLVALLLSRRSPLPLATAKRAGDGKALARVLGVSGPAFAEKLVYHAGYLGFVAIIGLLGATVMAANQALIGVEAVCFLSADGFGIAAGALVAQKLGAGRPIEAAKAGWLAATMAALLLTSFGLLFAIAPRVLVSAFSADATIVAIGARALLVAAVAQPFMAVATVLGMALRGAGDTRTPLTVTLVCALFVRVGATWFFAITLGWGLVGVWLGSTADWVLRALLLTVAYARGRWRAVAI